MNGLTHTHTRLLLSINLCFSPARGREPLSVFQCMDILLINLVDSTIRLCCLPGRSGWQIEIFGDNFAQITNCWSFFIFILVPKPQKRPSLLKVCKNAFEEAYKKSLHILQYQDNFLIRYAASCQKSSSVFFDLTPALILSLHVRDRKWVFYERSLIISLISFSLFVVKGHCKPFVLVSDLPALLSLKNDKYLPPLRSYRPTRTLYVLYDMERTSSIMCYDSLLRAQ